MFCISQKSVSLKKTTITITITIGETNLLKSEQADVGYGYVM